MRIEAGREQMISRPVRKPADHDGIVQWRDALKEGRALLRDIIDLDATYGGKPDLSARRTRPPRLPRCRRQPRRRVKARAAAEAKKQSQRRR